MALRREVPLWEDILAGAVAGGIGTWVMSPTMRTVKKLQPETDKKWEKEASWDEGSTVKAAKRVARPLGLELEGERKQKAGTLVHWGYGIAWGVGYSLLSRSMRRKPRGLGLLFGAALWLFGDEIAVPALGFAPGPQAYPPSTHLKALISHLAYGSATDGAYRLARRALA